MAKLLYSHFTPHLPSEANKLKKSLYQFRIVGLEEPDGQIKWAHLNSALQALVTTAKRATHLRVTGSSSIKGKTTWLAESVDFTIGRLLPGSTVVPIALSPLRATGCAKFLQSQLFDSVALPSENATALDLASDAINEALSENSAGDYFDDAILDAALKFKSIGNASMRYELTSSTNDNFGFSLDTEKYPTIQVRKRGIPSPKSLTVSGMLNEIKHADGHFRLVIANRTTILGRLIGGTQDREKLRGLWGKPVTISGVLHSKANGQPRMVDAQRIVSKAEGDQVFERLPLQVAGEQLNLLGSPTSKKSKQSTDPMVLWGSWPGNESMEELLAQLD